MNRLYKTNGYVTQEGDVKYYLNICGAAPQCNGDDIAACEIDIKTKHVTIIGLTSFMTHLKKFDPMPGISYSYTGQSMSDWTLNSINNYYLVDF